MPVNFAGLFLGHLLKCLAIVASLICQGNVTKIWLGVYSWFGLCIVFYRIYKLSNR